MKEKITVRALAMSAMLVSMLMVAPAANATSICVVDQGSLKAGCVSWYGLTPVGNLVPDNARIDETGMFAGAIALCFDDVMNYQRSVKPCNPDDLKVLVPWVGGAEDWCNGFAETGIGCETNIKEPVIVVASDPPVLGCYSTGTLHIDADGDGTSEYQIPNSPHIEVGGC